MPHGSITCLFFIALKQSLNGFYDPPLSCIFFSPTTDFCCHHLSTVSVFFLRGYFHGYQIKKIIVQKMPPINIEIWST
jgi:hypothetical protein